MTLEINVLARDRHKNVAELNQLMGPQSSLSWYSTALHYTDKNTQYKPAQIHFHSNRPHIITKINDNINMDSTKAGSVNGHC
jgi:hypothetical protein